jgi:glycosyltransferase involved in cell wall biosynthesis
LIPTYDRAEYVGGAIETVLAQTYTDIEAVVVNDGSTDGTRSVLAEYAENDRVQVHHNDRNRGIASSFNRAAEEARGDLLCILGDDDRWHPRKVEKQVRKMDALPAGCGVVYTGGVMTDGELVTKRYRPERRGDIYPEVLAEFGLHPHSGHMIRREAFEAVGGFDPAFARGVDWDLAIRLAREYDFEYVPGALVRRVYHGSNVSDEPAQVTVRDRIAEKYAAGFARHPPVRRRFESKRKRLRVRWELRYGTRSGAIEQALSALRTAPSTATAIHLLLALSGRRGYRVAGHTRRRFVDALASLGPDGEATAAR